MPPCLTSTSPVVCEMAASRTYDLEKVGFVCIVLVARCAANDGSAAACRNLSFVLKSGPSRLPSR